MGVDTDRVGKASRDATRHVKRMRSELKRLEKCYGRLGNALARDPAFAAENAALRQAIEAAGRAIGGLEGTINGMAARTQYSQPARR